MNFRVHLVDSSFQDACRQHGFSWIFHDLHGSSPNFSVTARISWIFHDLHGSSPNFSVMAAAGKSARQRNRSGPGRLRDTERPALRTSFVIYCDLCFFEDCLGMSWK